MKFLLFFYLTIHLFANPKQEMFHLYQKDQYNKVCKIGFKNFSKYNKDEEFVSLYAFACLKADYIDRLSTPISTLKFSPEARANAAYFATILMQKKLLYHSMLDGYDISQLKIPSTNFVLSKVFDAYVKMGFRKPQPFYLFEDIEDLNKKYKLYLLKSGTIYKMVIEELHGSEVIKKHTYW